MNSVRSFSVNELENPEYRTLRVKSLIFIFVLAALLIAAVLLSLRAGSYNTPVKELIKGILGIAEDNKVNIVVRKNRMPRICTAIISGAGLGLTGCILQAILRNPLASGSTLGVSQGATFGAAMAIVVLGLDEGFRYGVPLCAFIGSITVAVIILGLSRFRRITPEGIVLAGVAISAMFTGATTLIQYFADDVELAAIVFWTFGDLGSTSWQEIRLMGIIVLGLLIYCLIHRWDYNALLGGEELAASLGLNIKKVILLNMILCCLTNSVIVSNVGLINFIGLIAPHIVRTVVGNNHVYLITGSVLAGSTILLLSDLFARVAVMPVVLPIGAITSFLGGPIFLYLLFKGGKDK